MKRLILFTALVIFAQFANAENMYSNLSRIERQLFHQTYEYDLPKNRIERLETKLFGTYQSGKLENRYNLIKTAAKSYGQYSPDTSYNNRKQVYNQYRPPIFTGSTGSNWRNMLWGNLMNQFSGYPTGLSPQLSPGMDPAYMDYFEAERAMMHNGYNQYYSNPRGYRSTKTDRGSKTSVHILD